jgi:hypothetical protein
MVGDSGSWWRVNGKRKSRSGIRKVCSVQVIRGAARAVERVSTGEMAGRAGSVDEGTPIARLFSSVFFREMNSFGAAANQDCAGRGRWWRREGRKSQNRHDASTVPMA